MTLQIPEAGAPRCSHCKQLYRDGKPVRYFYGEEFLHADCVPAFIHENELRELSHG